MENIQIMKSMLNQQVNNRQDTALKMKALLAATDDTYANYDKIVSDLVPSCYNMQLGGGDNDANTRAMKKCISDMSDVECANVETATREFVKITKDRLIAEGKTMDEIISMVNDNFLDVSPDLKKLFSDSEETIVDIGEIIRKFGRNISCWTEVLNTEFELKGEAKLPLFPYDSYERALSGSGVSSFTKPSKNELKIHMIWGGVCLLLIIIIIIVAITKKK